MSRLNKRKFINLSDVAYILLCILISLPLFTSAFTYHAKLISPISKANAEDILPRLTITPSPTPLPSPSIDTPQKQEIADYINQVFGVYSDKAFYLLTCENKDLNPDIVNTAGNYPEGSRDTGVFQINEYWQNVQFKFLLNYKINVEIAYQLFSENNNSFDLWTCGRKLGI